MIACLALAGVSVAAISKYEIALDERDGYLAGFKATTNYGLSFYHDDPYGTGTASGDTNFASVLDKATYTPCSDNLAATRLFSLKWKYLQGSNSIAISHSCDDYTVSGNPANSCWIDTATCAASGTHVQAFPSTFPGCAQGESGADWSVDVMTATFMRLSTSQGILQFNRLPEKAMPDLIPDSLKLFKIGTDSLLLTLQLLNFGGKPIKGVEYEVFYNGARLGKDTVDSLPSQVYTTKLIQFPRIATTATIKVVVDPENKIIEASEKNNIEQGGWLTPGGNPVGVRVIDAKASEGGSLYIDALGRISPLGRSRQALQPFLRWNILPAK
jgi:hypothetical protein